jgi:hypothetical protein
MSQRQGIEAAPATARDADASTRELRRMARHRAAVLLLDLAGPAAVPTPATVRAGRACGGAA